MKKYIVLIFAGLFGGALSSYATTVTFGAGAGSRIVVDSAATEISTTSLIWEGTFSSAGSIVFNPNISIAANVAAIQAAGGWQQFGLNPSTQAPEAATNTLAIVNSFGHSRIGGTITDNVSGSPTASADFFNGKQVYLWVFNSSTVSGATEMGIFDASSTWLYPTNAGGLGDSVSYGTTSATSVVAVPGVGSASSSNLTLVASVPEPSTLATLAGATGLIAMLRRRRPAKL